MSEVKHTPGPSYDPAFRHATEDDLLDALPPVYRAAPDLLEALVTALPYVEGALDDEAFKAGAVKKDARKIRAAITRAESGE